MEKKINKNMKKFIYNILLLCSLCMLSSCEIDDDCLDDDIRRKFEQERNGSIERPGKSDDDSTVSIGESASLQRAGAFLSYISYTKTFNPRIHSDT